MDVRERKILARFDEASLQKLEQLYKTSAVSDRTGFKETVALLVVLTFTPETSDASAKLWLNYHERVIRIFSAVTCVKSRVESRRNYGKPLMRRIMSSDGNLAQPATVIGLPGPEEYRYLWKLTHSMAMEVPQSYSEGVPAALLYLIAMDAGISFQGISRAIEIPCFLQMFRHSGPNNSRNLGSLLSEYLALIRVCQFENYIGSQYWYMGMTETFDFSILEEHKTIKYFSVKTVGKPRLQRYSEHLVRKSQPGGLEYQTNFVFGKDGESNAFMYDCDCSVCCQHPVRKININMESDFVESLNSHSCSCNKYLKDILGAMYLEIVSREIEETVEIYLISARVFYELRHAICTMNPEKFRGDKCKLRDNLIDHLTRCCNGMKEPERIETLRVMREQ